MTNKTKEQIMTTQTELSTQERISNIFKAARIPVVVGKDLEVKFSGKTLNDMSGTWKQHFPVETAGQYIADVLTNDPTAKVLSIKVVDRYEFQ